MPNISETLLQMNSNSCINPIHSSPFNFVAKTQLPGLPGRDAIHPSIVPGHTIGTHSHPADVCDYNLSPDQFGSFFTHPVQCKCLDSVKHGVMYLSLSSMVPPTTMEKASSQSNQSVNIGMLIRGVTEADYKADPLLCRGQN